MSRPTFVIIGAMKGGTTSLHGYLDAHPQIQMSAVKETNFFSGPPDGKPYTKGTERISRLDDYERLFDPDVAVRGEASPSYTMYPRRTGVPERMAQVVPDAKFIYLVRDPIERLLSHYHHSLSVDGRELPLREALGDYRDPECPFTCPGFYAAQLDRYLGIFPEERVLVIDQADLLRRREETLCEVFGFLDVEESFVSPQFGQEMNAGRDLRTHSSAVVFLRQVRTRVGPLWRSLPSGARRRIRTSVHQLAGQPLKQPSVDEGLRAELRELYADDVARLRALTGQPFAGWSV
jgi:hypothetical protein